MRANQKGRLYGFTLLELVAVIAILAILLTIALPSWQSFMQRVHRSEAVVALLDLAACQEQIFATSGRYDTSQCIPEELDHYTITIEPPDATRSLVFNAWAEPTGAQSEDVCESFGLDQTGLRQVSAALGDADKCWNIR